MILDRYEVQQIFTSGGMGLVYRVHHRGWGMALAVKSPRPEFLQTAEQIESFEREAETWVDIGSEVLPLRKFGQINSKP